VVAGNGAAELIKSVVDLLPGKMGIIKPTFDEYPNRKNTADQVIYNTPAPNFKYTADELIKFFSGKGIQSLILINPDIPTGHFMQKHDLIKISEWAESERLRLIVDESFADFADADENPSLLSADILNRYNNLIVIKSISKSFGVPGLRLGLLASGDKSLINDIKKDVAIWNINSFAEFFLQIFGKYRDDYYNAMIKFKDVRRDFVKELRRIPFLRTVDSQANFVLCEILPPFNSMELAQKLLSEHKILIRTLSGKLGLDGSFYCRMAIKTPDENKRLISALNNILK
jgi:histidinol-phosphate/aromatic aminotransferase/cobyric acid decarboxylase-like protein